MIRESFVDTSIRDIHGLKIGTNSSVIEQRTNAELFESLAKQMNKHINDNRSWFYMIISGAVEVGKRGLVRPNSIKDNNEWRSICAMKGQLEMFGEVREIFGDIGLDFGQGLTQEGNARDMTYASRIINGSMMTGVIPGLNYNDTMDPGGVEGLKQSNGGKPTDNNLTDNDRHTYHVTDGLVKQGVNVKSVGILTDVKGVLNSDGYTIPLAPVKQGNEVAIRQHAEDLKRHLHEGKQDNSVGGMDSKIEVMRDLGLIGVSSYSTHFKNGIDVLFGKSLDEATYMRIMKESL